MSGRYTVPVVVERTPRGERSSDVFSRLLSERIVFLGTPLDDDVANVVMAQMLHLDHESSEADIQLYINSPGGSNTALTAVYDTMRFVRADVATVCMGQAASAAAVLLAAGAPGKRMALAHSRVLLHQPSGEGQGVAADLEIQAAEILRVRSQVEEILSRHTGQTVERLRADTDRDKIFTAEQAREYGLVDEVVADRGGLRRKDLTPPGT
ncbi:ATP-dependent Clp protease proteolytic subunit [Nocardiopsis algeriensis]|uniref:ATP-dependent Clp protease proteolytic subunit n=1 Tax=Nocardiopsis algeriensis TaxID=1478215 RepID=A0A841IPQ7_9ACTN|nr:ATP-dependent Clp protease protease subunit [Nocardiopsis algeriensis]